MISDAAALLIGLVPGERIELPTNGLQNRCSTAELTRQATETQWILSLSHLRLSSGVTLRVNRRADLRKGCYP
jgi:hypothetical protein